MPLDDATGHIDPPGIVYAYFCPSSGGIELTAAATLVFVCVAVLRFLRQRRARRHFREAAGR